MQRRGSFARARFAVGLLLATASTAVVWAGEGVTFSGRRPDPRPAATSRTPGSRLTIQSPLNSFGPGASSLQAIPAPPFAAPRALPLSPRERELMEQRRDWIMQSSENRLDSRDEVNRAFGVRDYDPDTAAKKKKESETDKGTLTRYYEKLEAEESAPAEPGHSKPEETDSLSPMGLEPLPAYGGYDSYLSPGNRAGAGNDPMSPRLNDISAGLRSDPFGAAAREAGRWPQPFEAERPGSRKPSFSFQSGTGGESAAQPSSVERLLGGNPIDTTVSRGPVSSLDPVTAYPDPTREALNPVIAPPVTSLGSPLQADGSVRDRSLAVSPSSALRDLGGSPLRSSFGAISTGPRVERRTLNSMKVQLDAPRRSF